MTATKIQPVHPAVARIFSFAWGAAPHAHEAGVTCMYCAQAFRDDEQRRRLARGGR